MCNTILLLTSSLVEGNEEYLLSRSKRKHHDPKLFETARERFRTNQESLSEQYSELGHLRDTLQLALEQAKQISTAVTMIREKQRSNVSTSNQFFSRSLYIIYMIRL